VCVDRLDGPPSCRLRLSIPLCTAIGCLVGSDLGISALGGEGDMGVGEVVRISG